MGAAQRVIVRSGSREAVTTSPDVRPGSHLLHSRYRSYALPITWLLHSAQAGEEVIADESAG